MQSDAVLQNLLALYAGLTFLNAVFAAALWRSTRDRTVRTLFLAWTSVMVAFVGQGVLVGGALAVTLGFSLVFLNNLAFAAVLAGIADVRTPWGPLIGTYVVGLALSCAAAVAGLGFTAVALPTALAVAAPCVVVSASVFRRRWSTLTAQGRALTLSCLFFSAHNVDFAFLRMRESFATIGFTVALVVVFALSISAPAALLEQVAGRQARLSAQLDIARALQRRLVPDDARLEGLDFAAHMRPADSVGGDYLHLFRTPDADWFFVLDVAGHGFGAGLIALMAHSTVASIIEARPDASPRELNDLREPDPLQEPRAARGETVHDGRLRAPRPRREPARREREPRGPAHLSRGERTRRSGPGGPLPARPRVRRRRRRQHRRGRHPARSGRFWSSSARTVCSRPRGRETTTAASSGPTGWPTCCSPPTGSRSRS